MKWLICFHIEQSRKQELPKKAKATLKPVVKTRRNLTNTLSSMFNQILKDKIGNTLIYISNSLGGSVFLAKAIKLLYLLDEQSIRETGVPFTWLDYKVWKNGPVPEELHTELRYKTNNQINKPEYSEYIKVTETENPVNQETGAYLLSPVKDFCDDEFSDYDINLMDRILRLHGNKSGNQLINLLHEEGTLWDKVVKENNLDLSFALRSNKSDFSIPFTELLRDDEIRQLAYKSAFSSLSFSEQIRG